MPLQARLLVPALAAALLPAQQDAAAVDGPAVDVRVDPRVELLSIVFRLAGNPEYSQGRVARYTEAVDAHFGRFRNHAAVQHARRLRAMSGVSFDAVAGFAIHLDEAMPPGEGMPFEPLPERLDRRWVGPDVARAFLADLREFAEDADAKAFFASQRELYAHAEAQMRKTLREHADLSWFDRFFGARPGARFRLALGLLNGGANYGPSALRPDGSEELYCILGCWTTDQDGMPMFPRTVVATVAHEFCHSYCNPVVDAHLEDLAAAGQRLFEQVEQAMRDQAYGNARTLLCESLVRACVVRYRAGNEDDRAAAEEVAEQRRRSFFWVGGLADLLRDEYEKDRARHPTLEEFTPRLVEFFTAAGPKLERELARRPKVAKVTPADGATDVDPALAAIVVEFDRPMRDGKWSVVRIGGEFPEVRGKPSYDDARKVLTIPVALQPGREYRFGLNSSRHEGFVSEDGEVLLPVQVRFRTRAR